METSGSFDLMIGWFMLECFFGTLFGDNLAFIIVFWLFMVEGADIFGLWWFLISSFLNSRCLAQLHGLYIYPFTIDLIS